MPWLYSSLSKCVIMCGFTEKNVLLNFLFWPCKTTNESLFYLKKKSRKRCILVQVFGFYHKSRLSRIPKRNLSLFVSSLALLFPSHLYCMKECLPGTVDICQLQGLHILRKSSLSKNHLPRFIFQYR